jgi:hypothetical protein
MRTTASHPADWGRGELHRSINNPFSLVAISGRIHASLVPELLDLTKVLTPKKQHNEVSISSTSPQHFTDNIKKEEEEAGALYVLMSTSTGPRISKGLVIS